MAENDDDSVAFVRQDVLDSLDSWDRIRTCASGQDAVKSGRRKYLPKPNPEDTSEENAARYESYLTRAVYYNVTGNTKENLIGDAFDVNPAFTATDAMAVYRENIDGAGLSIDQQAQAVCSHVLLTGRHGLLVDYPVTEKPATKAEIKSLDIRPKIISVKSEDIINWRQTAVGGSVALSMVVIREAKTEYGEYSDKTVTQWRELALDNGSYRVTVYRQNEESKEFYIHEGPFYPADSSGKKLSFIPFFFVGSENNDPTIDNPPLENIANLNIGHYRNSADYEESCFMVGQPTIVLSGLTKSWVKDVLGGRIYLGSRGAIQLPEGGSATLMQAAPNSMPREAMQDKERQMISLGARLVEAKQVQRTATESSIDSRAQHSRLGIIAGNISSAYTKALTVFAQFIGASVDVSYQLNTDYDLQTIGVTERQQLLSELQAGGITWLEYRARLRGAGIATEDDEAAAESISANLSV